MSELRNECQLRDGSAPTVTLALRDACVASGVCGAVRQPHHADHQARGARLHLRRQPHRLRGGDCCTRGRCCIQVRPAFPNGCGSSQLIPSTVLFHCDRWWRRRGWRRTQRGWESCCEASWVNCPETSWQRSEEKASSTPSSSRKQKVGWTKWSGVEVKPSHRFSVWGCKLVMWHFPLSLRRRL